MFIRAKNLLLAKTTAGRSPIYPGETVEVEDAVGREFVELKAAVEVTPAEAERAGKAALGDNPNGNTPEVENAPETPKTGENGNVDLEAMSFADLKAMAQEMGIDTGKIRSKAGMIDAITAAQTDPGDDFPDLTAQDVVDE